MNSLRNKAIIEAYQKIYESKWDTAKIDIERLNKVILDFKNDESTFSEKAKLINVFNPKSHIYNICIHGSKLIFQDGITSEDFTENCNKDDIEDVLGTLSRNYADLSENNDEILEYSLEDKIKLFGGDDENAEFATIYSIKPYLLILKLNT